MSETSTIVRPTIELIRKLGIPCERIQCGWARGIKGGRMKLASSGTPDIWSALGWLEAKLPGDKNTSEETRLRQAAWRERAQAWGVRVAQYESTEEAVRIVTGWVDDHRFRKAMGWEGP